MNHCKEKYTLEYFVFHKELIEIVRKNSREDELWFMEAHTGNREVIEKAILLIRYLKVEKPIIPQSQIQRDYQLLMDRLSKRKRIKYYRISISAAACSIIILLSVFRWTVPDQTTNPGLLLSLLDSTPPNSTEVRIIAGDNHLKVGDSAVIRQTQQGTLIIGEEEFKETIPAETENLQLIVPYGKRSVLTFSDGSTAWVNSGTTIIYPQVFKKDKREILVDGEIYIEVAEDAKKPFIVRTRKFEVKVLGTRFNVNSYKQDDTGFIILEEGRVEVTANEEKTRLYPNYGLFYTEEGCCVKEVDVYSYVSWKDGIMKLNGETLGVIFDRLGRYYNLQFHYEQSLSAGRYNGKLNLTDSIQTILHNLSLSTPFSYEMDSGKIYIRE